MAVLVPFEKLSADALSNLISEYVTRDGTDYGLVELSEDQKIKRVESLLKRGEVLIVFDELSETCDLLTKEQWAEREFLSE